MIKLGQFNFLSITQNSSRGALLKAGSLGMAFLPARQIPPHCEVGDKVQVFLYRDSNNELIATTKKPRIQVGGVACLKVLSVNKIGAFLDWGLPKDLFVPFGEQSQPMQEGEFYIVRAYEDNQGRICASSKLNKFIQSEAQGLANGQSVNLIVAEKTDLGYKMIVNQSFWGLIHHQDVFRELRYGQHLKGFIKKVRTDKRLDISLQAAGKQENLPLAKKILALLEQQNGFSELNDKSPPEIIYQTFGVSKKVFKAEIGRLYKLRKITIEKNGIRLSE